MDYADESGFKNKNLSLFSLIALIFSDDTAQKKLLEVREWSDKI